jgi:hypothetical protein
VVVAAQALQGLVRGAGGEDGGPVRGRLLREPAVGAPTVVSDPAAACRRTVRLCTATAAAGGDFPSAGSGSKAAWPVPPTPRHQ